jgi:hypothetical protein
MSIGDSPSYNDPDWEWSDLHGWRRKARLWIETNSMLGGTRIYNTAGEWVYVPASPQLEQRVAELERRVARLETMQRRKPKRKAGRR